MEKLAKLLMFFAVLFLLSAFGISAASGSSEPRNYTDEEWSLYGEPLGVTIGSSNGTLFFDWDVVPEGTHRFAVTVRGGI